MKEKLPQLLDNVKKTVTQHGWNRLLLAVSGGLDSICLAHFFICNQEFLGLRQLAIAHVHHGLRKESADIDAEFVKDFANKNKIVFYLERLGKRLQKQKGSLEENARIARYDALRKFKQDFGADAIVTAHHGDDQAETVYLRIRRGVGIAGLRGIQPVTEDLFRPFLQWTRKDLLEYAQHNQLKWREDESNRDKAFARNKIRHECLPTLERIQPDAARQLRYLAELAQKAYCKILAETGNLFDKAIVETSQWPFDKRFSPYGKVLAISLPKIPENFRQNIFQFELFRLWLDTKGFRLPIGEKANEYFHPPFTRIKSILIEKTRDTLWICDMNTTQKQNNLYLVDEQIFSDNPEGLRFRREGDILWPQDEKIKPRKLEKWLHQQGIPRWMYDCLPLQAQGSRILFVHGLRLPGK